MRLSPRLLFAVAAAVRIIIGIREFAFHISRNSSDTTSLVLGYIALGAVLWAAAWYFLALLKKIIRPIVAAVRTPPAWP